jgi:hypothetical protein
MPNGRETIIKVFMIGARPRTWCHNILLRSQTGRTKKLVYFIKLVYFTPRAENEGFPARDVFKLETKSRT